MTDIKDPTKILFVCMGNICRSPTAEGVFRSMAHEAGLGERLVADSAGTHAYHLGEAPDPRSQAAAVKRGYDLSALRARRIDESDFRQFDLILAMDNDNLRGIERIRPAGGDAAVELFLRYADSGAPRDMPDPYYGGARGFDYVLDLVEDASRGLLDSLSRSR